MTAEGNVEGNIEPISIAPAEQSSNLDGYMQMFDDLKSDYDVADILMTQVTNCKFDQDKVSPLCLLVSHLLKTNHKLYQLLVEMNNVYASEASE